MLKKSPSRGTRSKGIKVKHILQIVLLVGVCCWLIYQVKRSHDKKKEFGQTDNEILSKTPVGGDVLKLGRKDLHPHVEEVHPGENQEEEEEEETRGEEEDTKQEEEEEREELKHEAINEEDEGSKHEEKTEDDVKGGRDVDVGENDQEKADKESDHEGENVDDERLKEGSAAEAGGNEERDNQENEGSEQSTHEAREENYKGDDASSAVAHDDHSTTSVTEEVNSENSENSDELLELNSKEHDNESGDTLEFNRTHNSSQLTEVDKMVDNGNSTIENSSNVKLNGNTSLPTDGSVGNPILTSQSDDPPELSNNTSSATTEPSKVENADSSHQNETDSQVTDEVVANGTSTNENLSGVKLNENTSLPTDSILTTQSNDPPESSNSKSSAIPEINNSLNADSSQQNGTEIGLNHPEEKTIDNLTARDETLLPSSILTNLNNTVLANNISESQPNTSSKDENPNGVEGETLNISNKADITVTGDKTTELENVLPTMITQEKRERTQNEKFGDNGESDGNNSGSANHTEDLVQEDPIDSNDSHATERVDLDTLPDIRSEVDHSEETTAD